MKIHVNHLTLRFYKHYGWTKEKVRDLLINKSLEIVYRKDSIFENCNYYAVYDQSGHKIFSKELIWHEFDNPNNYDIEWYIKRRS